ncbi:CMRF35-like molecule 6 [Sorex araneus]|uniref:CMRF35-like molecule 6 n=1 Tax=Sorex araneus TaxID=42254 RepID=UPI002433DDD4|nr:CMRF35-like molecule 6 [Sorex araneus]
MSPWVRAPWLPWALLLANLPGCVSVRGPDSVHGTVGGSLSVHCMYDQGNENDGKYWCEYPCRLGTVLETSATQREARRGRVTIRDNPANLTFTVTLENLMEADAGSYLCGVLGFLHKSKPQARVKVSVSPAEEFQERGGRAQI